ncbi:AgmX/PglI C-terminal domain-containing protein [Pyxidicoccus parkwayensis]|uniref:AgmX/PglI C-terminal domain-containing protein n=1 Tax=Pyxidicoccus parkwayensis TaxID=2813578 RepID=A0ABX7NR06_9BACT|nr:AgmX/PglI C-terminal domain-containing protein [Pyxidicoccus parkwaysis]QSQ20863.1 AgmX/PglI C-terminal domain-containing protein [Pyxidicoccus parkwaysis]
MGELLSGAEGQFRGQGMGTPGTGPANGVRGPVPGAPLSVEEALDADLDAYLDRELFVRPSEDSAPQATEPESEPAESMRALLDLAEEESQWLETLPPPAIDVTPPPEPEAPPVEIPEWMRASPGAKVTTPFAEMLAPVEPAQVHAHEGTDAAGLPVTPWSEPASAQHAGAPVYPCSLLPGIAPPPPDAAIPAWSPHHAMPQQWGMPLPAPVEPKRIAGMKAGSLFGAAAVGALTAGLLVVAGLHYREHMLEAHDAAGVGARGALASTNATTGVQAAGTVLPSGAQVGATGVQPTGGASTGLIAGQTDTSQSQVVTGTAPNGLIAGQPGTSQAAQTSTSGVPGTVAASQNGTTALAQNTEANDAQQAAASVSTTVLSTAQSDMQGAASNLRAAQSEEPLKGSAVGGTTLTSGHTDTIALTMPSARKQAAKTVLTKRPAADTEAEAAPGELNFHESEAGADEESTPAEDTEAEAQQSELDEDFARELGFTDDAKAKPDAPKEPERTVYIPPSPDAKERLTPDDVKGVVVANQPAITACIRQHAQGTPMEKGGRFMVRWSINPSGDTSNVSMDTDTLKATPLAHCIEDVVRHWKFPVHQVRMEEPIRFPFVF